ncbi:SpoIID/LytB domain-containing protein [Schaedlerella arabinosiphila]|uniref:SpoIID/LytB domain-containing protein n=1 Tax=Schaedlerella arabinosiphila TaxID=2044587 RepID=UPI002558147D|nr:SpoIID/LytB domain-containing protein [Schaedlerella arabinosiphila]
MRQRATWQKFKTFGSFCLIMLLLPYIVTVFVHGKDFEALGNKDKVFINVRKPKAGSSLAQMESISDTVEANSEENRAGIWNGLSDQEKETQIVQVPWEEYFVGIMGREVPVNAEMEFLKAQAVLLRTKLYQELDAQEPAATQPADAPENTGQQPADAPENIGQQPADAPGNTTQQPADAQGNTGQQPADTPASGPSEKKVLDEEYLTREELEKKAGSSEVESYYNNLLQAMRDTENQVLLYQDDYAFLPFHQSSNGTTRSAQEVMGTDAYPYLAVRECPLDKDADDEMLITSFDYKDVQAKCRSFLVAVAEDQANKTYQFSDFEIISHDSAGYVQEMRIGETVCTGDQFRDAMSLASSAFSIKDTNGKLQVTTTGKGHGLGLSQWTAQQMAKSGKNYEEILQFFFEGTTLTDGGPVKEKIE